MAFANKINMWSGPRNVSTALMYSFSQREDTQVVDEPFYAHYLLQSGATHPGRMEVLENQSKDPTAVIQNLLTNTTDKSVLFIKNMAHHMISMERALEQLFAEFQHVFLIRSPREMLPSLGQKLENLTMQDTAYQRQFELFSEVTTRNLPFQVIDSTELLKNPEFILSELCQNLELSFDPSMLSWPQGPIAEDGVWAKYWYKNVHKSKGFKPYQPKDNPLPKELIPLYEQCKPLYDKMLAHAIKFNS